MLLQANTLDERETFSPAAPSRLAERALFYVTHHLQPARTRLATVVAFDLPINDLIPPGMTIDSFRIEPDPSQNLATTPDQRERRSYRDHL